MVHEDRGAVRALKEGGTGSKESETLDKDAWEAIHAADRKYQLPRDYYVDSRFSAGCSGKLRLIMELHSKDGYRIRDVDKIPADILLAFATLSHDMEEWVKGNRAFPEERVHHYGIFVEPVVEE